MINSPTVNNSITFGFLNSVVFRIGCLFYTENDTCPLEGIIGTWTKIGTKILTDVSSATSIPVRGNGKTLGIFDGANGYGMSTLTSTWGLVAGDTYNTPVGTGTPLSGYMTAVKSVGVTNDQTKSGLIADTSTMLGKTELTINIFKRTA